MAIDRNSIIPPNSQDNVSSDKGQMRLGWYKYQQAVTTALNQLNTDTATNNTLISSITSSLTALTTLVNNNSNVGDLKTNVSNTALTGWLLCDGSEVSRVTYVNLYNVIGVSFGIGDGHTTFNLPNSQGVFLLQAGGIYTPGMVGGEATHQLNVYELPAHTHAVIQAAATVFVPNGTGHVDLVDGVGTAMLAASNTVSIDNQGGDASHNNMPPYLVSGYVFIKY